MSYGAIACTNTISISVSNTWFNFEGEEISDALVEMRARNLAGSLEQIRVLALECWRVLTVDVPRRCARFALPPPRFRFYQGAF